MPENEKNDRPSTFSDIENILNSDAVKRMEERIAAALEKKKDADKREGVKDQIFDQAMSLLDLLIDTWADLKVQKALEDRFQEDVDEIDDIIREIRDKLREVYQDASNSDSEEDFNNLQSKVRDLQNKINDLKNKVSRLERKNQRALMEELRELREARKKRQGQAEKAAEQDATPKKGGAKTEGSR